MEEQTPKGLFFKDLEPFDLAELMDPAYLKIEGKVEISTIPVQKFYEDLSELKKNKATKKMGNTIAACPGGLFRSSYINSALFKAGVDQPHKHSRSMPGVSLDHLIESFELGSLDERGRLEPLAFQKPIDNLLIGIDTEGEEKEILFRILCRLKFFQQKHPGDINLNIVIVNGIEEDHQEAEEKFPELF